jgi:hypothetical protein
MRLGCFPKREFGIDRRFQFRHSAVLCVRYVENLGRSPSGGDRFGMLHTPGPGQQRTKAQGGMNTTAIARTEEHRRRAVSNIFPR